ncbi:MAG: hypothetical protein Q8O32_01830 [bacterium]|nr:hypothetical protein [bacterium]
MGQALKKDSVFLKHPPRDHFDFNDLLLCVLWQTPELYYLEEGQAIATNLFFNDCSELHPYFALLKQRALEEIELEESLAEDILNGEETLSIADRDIDCNEYGSLEEQFELGGITIDFGFIIICLPSSVLVFTPWNTPEGNENKMLDGFDLKASNIPRVPITCQWSYPS